MKCLKFRKLLIEYTDGQLQDKQCKKLEYHLRNCQKCRNELRDLETSLQMVMDTVDEDVLEPSTDFIPELRREIEKLDSKADSEKTVWSEISKLAVQPKIWITTALASLLILFSILILPRFDSSRKVELTPAELQVIENHPEGETLIEMLPASRPYIKALLKAQEEKKAQEKIITTINSVNPQLWEKVINLLEFSADALENSNTEEEEKLLCNEEIVI